MYTSCLHSGCIPSHLQEKKDWKPSLLSIPPSFSFQETHRDNPIPQTGWTEGILLDADKTAGKAERCRVMSVKLGTYILRGAVTFNDTKDKGNSDGNYLCSYSFRWGIYWQEVRKGRKLERTWWINLEAKMASILWLRWEVINQGRWIKKELG